MIRVRRGSAGVKIERAGIVRTFVAWLVGLVTFFPFLYLVLSGFKSEIQASQMPPLIIPAPGGLQGLPLAFSPTLDYYANVLGSGFLPYLVNSLIAVLGSSVLVFMLALPAAYALGLGRMTHHRDVLFFFVSTRFLPVVGVIIPIFIIAKDAHLLDNVLALVIMYTAMNLPLAVWMLRSYFADIPRDILDAARVDGANVVQELGYVALPMIRPGVVATFFIGIIFAWNEFFLAVILTAVKSTTVPIYMLGFESLIGLFWAQLAAAGTMAALPIVLLGWVAQGQLVRGMSMGAIK